MDLPAHLTAHSLHFPYGIQPSPSPLDPPTLSASTLAGILTHLSRKEITLLTARHLLTLCEQDAASEFEEVAFPGPNPGFLQIRNVIDKQGLRLTPVGHDEYAALAAGVVAQNADMADKVRAEVAKGGVGRAGGKIMWFVGRMVRAPGMEERVEPDVAGRYVREALGLAREEQEEEDV